MEFIRKIVQKMTKVKDMRHFYDSRKEVHTSALIASATGDMSQSELLIV